MGPPGVMFPKARTNAAKALELDETVASAHIALSTSLCIRVAMLCATSACKWSARQVHPQAYEACLKGNFFRDKMTPEDLEKSVGFFTRAIELDLGYARAYGDLSRLILYRARRYDESIAQCQKALEIDPHYANALWFLALSLEQKGDLSGAIAKLEKAASLSRGPHYQAQSQS
jgi:tetratricopeptide (TPR) repeat protein